MKVLKFGGTSVGSAERIKAVAELINNNEPKIVVLSAMAGTTNSLVDIANYLYKKNSDGANNLINELEIKYKQVVEELFKTEAFKQKGKELILSHFKSIKLFTQDSFTLFEEKAILAQGELISTALFNFYLEESKIKSALLPALNFMRIDKSDEPDMFYIKENIERELKAHPDIDLFITQGYICRDAYGEIDNLKRGGSDYTASLIGSAINAEEIQIWTDIDGMHNNDPRYVENTKSISQLSFNEAAELAYFGAKILHPTSIFPAQLAEVPVRLKNTLDPNAPGTLITNKRANKGQIKAIAAKDGITAIKIISGRMLMAYGFFRKTFEIFERYKTPIDMVTTAEVGISLTIDDPKYLPEIIDDLKKYGNVEIDKDHVIICVVGDMIAENKGLASKIFDALKEIPIRMISYGGSKYNISILVKSDYKKDTLVALSKHLF